MKRITRIASSLFQRKNSESNAAGEMEGLRIDQGPSEKPIPPDRRRMESAEIGPGSLSMETKAGNLMSYKRPEALPVNF